MFACQSKISEPQEQQRVLQGFNSIFRNKVAMVRLACLSEDKVEVGYEPMQNFVWNQFLQNNILFFQLLWS